MTYIPPGELTCLPHTSGTGDLPTLGMNYIPNHMPWDSYLPRGVTYLPTILVVTYVIPHSWGGYLPSFQSGPYLSISAQYMEPYEDIVTESIMWPPCATPTTVRFCSQGKGAPPVSMREWAVVSRIMTIVPSPLIK